MSGHLFIVSAPSGAGKTTLVRRLLQSDSRVHLSISHTTRGPRPGEQDGREYHFIDVASFKAMAERGDFLESAEVHGNFYGTSRPWIESQMAQGLDILLEIDWQGAAQVRKVFPEAIGIFILPPSMAELERRLVSRAQDSAEVIARRLAAARDEISHIREFQYVIINKELQNADRDLAAVIQAARLQCSANLAEVRAAFPDVLP